VKYLIVLSMLIVVLFLIPTTALCQYSMSFIEVNEAAGTVHAVGFLYYDYPGGGYLPGMKLELWSNGQSLGSNPWSYSAGRAEVSVQAQAYTEYYAYADAYAGQISFDPFLWWINPMACITLYYDYFLPAFYNCDGIYWLYGMYLYYIWPPEYIPYTTYYFNQTYTDQSWLYVGPLPGQDPIPTGEITYWEGWWGNYPCGNHECIGGLYSAQLTGNASFQYRMIQEELSNTSGDRCQQLNQGTWELTIPPNGPAWTVNSDNTYATWGNNPGPDLVAAYYEWIDYYINYGQIACDVNWRQDLKISPPGGSYQPYESHYIGVGILPLPYNQYQVWRQGVIGYNSWPF
jgi:hypothetical protein